MKNAIVVLSFISFASVSGDNRQNVPAAPLPASVVNAKKVFLTNGGCSNLAFDAFYSGIAHWAKYDLVGSIGDADLIIELAYTGTRVWSTSDDSTTEVHSRQIVDPQLVLTIYDAKTEDLLWSEVHHPRLARGEKNREKEIIKSAEWLAADLKARAEIHK